MQLGYSPEPINLYKSQGVSGDIIFEVTIWPDTVE